MLYCSLFYEFRDIHASEINDSEGFAVLRLQRIYFFPFLSLTSLHSTPY